MSNAPAPDPALSAAVAAGLPSWRGPKRAFDHVDRSSSRSNRRRASAEPDPCVPFLSFSDNEDDGRCRGCSSACAGRLPSLSTSASSATSSSVESCVGAAAGAASATSSWAGHLSEEPMSIITTTHPGGSSPSSRRPPLACPAWDFQPTILGSVEETWRGHPPARARPPPAKRLRSDPLCLLSAPTLPSVGRVGSSSSIDVFMAPPAEEATLSSELDPSPDRPADTDALIDDEAAAGPSPRSSAPRRGLPARLRLPLPYATSAPADVTPSLRTPTDARPPGAMAGGGPPPIVLHPPAHRPPGPKSRLQVLSSGLAIHPRAQAGEGPGGAQGRPGPASPFPLTPGIYEPGTAGRERMAALMDLLPSPHHPSFAHETAHPPPSLLPPALDSPFNPSFPPIPRRRPFIDPAPPSPPDPTTPTNTSPLSLRTRPDGQLVVDYLGPADELPWSSMDPAADDVGLY